MLVGRRTVEVGSRREANQERGTESTGEGYPFSGPTFVLTHRPPDPPDPDVTYLSGDIAEAVATALDAARGKNLQILGTEASQCLRRGLVDEIMVVVLPVLLGDGPFDSCPPASAGQTWNRSAACDRATPPSSASASANSPTRPSDSAGCVRSVSALRCTPRGSLLGKNRCRRDGPVRPGDDANAVSGAVGEDPGTGGVGVLDDVTACGERGRQPCLDVLTSDGHVDVHRVLERLVGVELLQPDRRAVAQRVDGVVLGQRCIARGPSART